tara:strand:- start:17871 stop:18896 length:1026 start_codon:yes stop_codon:yes gene_type:complete
MKVKMISPPVGKYQNQVGCWADIRDDLLSGKLSDSLLAPYFIGEIGEELVGSMGCYLSKDTNEIGLVEFVETTEKHRTKGIANALLTHLINYFTSIEGKVLFLCTTNPIAGALYEKQGFWYTVGDGMRKIIEAKFDFDNTYFDNLGVANVRKAKWGDLPRATALYNHQEPDWFIKDYITSSFNDTRYERHFIQVMKGCENDNGKVFVLENLAKRLVGLLAFQRQKTFYEQHCATVSFRICPTYQNQLKDLIGVAIEAAKKIKIDTFNIHISNIDDEQKDLLDSVGFSEIARIPGQFNIGATKLDMLIYQLIIGPLSQPYRGKGDYYAGRQDWQKQRLTDTR